MPGQSAAEKLAASSLLQQTIKFVLYLTSARHRDVAFLFVDLSQPAYWTWLNNSSIPLP